MIKVADTFAEQDKKKREEVEIKNEAEQYIYTSEKLISQDLKDKISQDQGIKVSNAIKDLKDVLDKGAAEIKLKLDELKKIVNEITTELYKTVTPPPGAGAQGAAGADPQGSAGSSGQASGGATN